MPALNFRACYAAKIIDGRKKQTIRRRRRDKRDPKPGDRLVLYTGMRTAYCCRLIETRCTKVVPVVIEEHDLMLDGRYLSFIDRTAFGIADGFSGFIELRKFFRETYGLPFHGIVIYWE